MPVEGIAFQKWHRDESFSAWYNRALWEMRKYGDETPPQRITYREARDFGLIPTYEEGRTYTERQLEWMADFMIFEHHSWNSHEKAILNPDMYIRRIRHEVFTKRGVPDPHIVSGLYWRTHPGGLRWRTPEQMKKSDASFYDT